ncbi:transposase [Peredibacter sp. HCB2-198]|uniref:transposase n=1 Tax=Peredibacter sp. HCB2-198 TaxID=3383025 RepID=UPI0038B5F9C2
MGKQLQLNVYKANKGGRRPGSGRKRVHSKGVAHRVRERVMRRTPLHINFKYRTLIRNKFCLRLLKRAILNARAHGLRVMHFSLQSNHVHLIIEAANNQVLTKGMRSLTVTFAKGLNKGRVQIERYHLHVLRGLRETKNAIQYVLFNQHKHEKGTYTRVDEYSSLLSLKENRKVIQHYAQRVKITIEIKRAEFWELEVGRSYLSRRGLELLT